MKTSDKRFSIKKTRSGTGRGLFASQPIKKGEFILEYTGRRIPTKAADESPSRYLFEINRNWTIDGPVPRNTAGYINHACKPNAEADIKNGRIVIRATKNIPPGREITMDYDKEYFDEFIKPVGCKCDSCLNPSRRAAN